MAITGVYFNLSYDQLIALQMQYLICLKDIAVIGKSYTVGQRSYSLADAGEVNQILLEIQAAINHVRGRRIRRAFPNLRFRNSFYQNQ